MAFAASALAVTGGGSAPSSIVMIASARSSVCTGTAIARDLILTAAHCMRLSGYRVVPQGGGAVKAARRALRQFG